MGKKYLALAGSDISRWYYNICRFQTLEEKPPEEYTHLHYRDLESLSKSLFNHC